MENEDVVVSKEIERASEAFDDFLKDCEDDNYDPVGVGVCFFAELIHFLVDCGWTKDELRDMVEWHAENQTSDGLT